MEKIIKIGPHIGNRGQKDHRKAEKHTFAGILTLKAFYEKIVSISDRDDAVSTGIRANRYEQCNSTDYIADCSAFGIGF